MKKANCGGITNRFAVYTGNAICDALLLTLDKDMRRKQKSRYSVKRDGDDRELFDIVASLCRQKNGEKFSRLYDRRDFSGYDSQSEADCTLCALIAFRTGADPAFPVWKVEYGFACMIFATYDEAIAFCNDRGTS